MPRSIVLSAAMAASCICLAACTMARDKGPSPDKSQYNLLNPTPPELMRSFKTDRPS
jgi:hypothetical protein